MDRSNVIEVRRKLDRGEDLTVVECHELIRSIVQRACSDEETAACLLALRAKGETVAELVGAVTALREVMHRIPTCHSQVIDTCGTGGDASHTFNISTAAALITAAAGLPVAKHGNRSVSSRSGSADVLRVLGVNIDAPRDCVQRCLEELGICFCFAPLWHESVRSIAEIRRQLGVPTIFNWIGPLLNPADARYQLLGVGQRALHPVVAQALAQLGTGSAAIVSGYDGLDEVTLSGPTDVFWVRHHDMQQTRWSPDDFGVRPSSLEALRVSGPEESGALIRSILSGQPGPARDIAVLNAAAALWVAGRAPSMAACRTLAEQAVDRKNAAQLLKSLVLMTRE